MDALQAEHDKVWNKSQLSKTADQAQDIINALQNARDTIANDPNSTHITLAKLQNPVKASFDGIISSLQDVNRGHVKYTKGLDKLFKEKPLPSSEIDALSAESGLVNRAIYLHLLREGLFRVASAFNKEAAGTFQEPQKKTASGRNDNDMDITPDIQAKHRAEMEERFAEMYYILHELKDRRNLSPAIEWARQNSEELENRGSNLEFELCRLQFVHLYQTAIDSGKGNDQYSSQSRALAYARREFQGFYKRYLLEIQQLMGAMAYASNLEESPYRHIFHDTTAWEAVAATFTREFCLLLELSADSPLYVAATAGAIALPTLLKLQKIVQSKRTEWTTANELAVEIPLPPSYQFHSIFVCPVSKEQTTDENPPMMMPCGHVLANESLKRISKGNRFKCPYCPNESHPREARKVFLLQIPRTSELRLAMVGMKGCAAKQGQEGEEGNECRVCAILQEVLTAYRLKT